MLPEAAVVFLEELLNANSAILNSPLMVLNERVFRCGRETRLWSPLCLPISRSESTGRIQHTTVGCRRAEIDHFKSVHQHGPIDWPD